MGGEGQSGWPACDVYGDQVISRHGQSRDHRMSVQVGTQRHGGEDLPRDPSAQGPGQVAHGFLQESSLGHNPRACRKLRNLVEKSKGSSPSATRRGSAGRSEMHPRRCGCTFPVHASLPLSSRTCITSCGLHRGGRKRVRDSYVCDERTAGSSASKTSRSGTRWERGRSCCAAAWPRAARG